MERDSIPFLGNTLSKVAFGSWGEGGGLGRSHQVSCLVEEQEGRSHVRRSIFSLDQRQPHPPESMVRSRPLHGSIHPHPSCLRMLARVQNQQNPWMGGGAGSSGMMVEEGHGAPPPLLPSRPWLRPAAIAWRCRATTDGASLANHRCACSLSDTVMVGARGGSARRWRRRCRRLGRVALAVGVDGAGEVVSAELHLRPRKEEEGRVMIDEEE